MTIKRFAFLTILLTYILIVFGGYVATSNSGMGCGPDWPLCNGTLIPILKGATLIEYAHRVIGAILGLMAVFLCIMILRRDVEMAVRSVAIVMIGFLTIQVLFGAFVVVYDLPPIIVTIHLIIAMLFLSCLIWIWREPSLDGVRQPFYSKSTIIDWQQKAIIQHLNVLLGLIILTLAFGAYIKHQSYGLACGWLGCRQSFLPTTLPEYFKPFIEDWLYYRQFISCCLPIGHL